MDGQGTDPNPNPDLEPKPQDLARIAADFEVWARVAPLWHPVSCSIGHASDQYRDEDGCRDLALDLRTIWTDGTPRGFEDLTRNAPDNENNENNEHDKNGERYEALEWLKQHQFQFCSRCGCITKDPDAGLYGQTPCPCPRRGTGRGKRDSRAKSDTLREAQGAYRTRRDRARLTPKKGTREVDGHSVPLLVFDCVEPVWLPSARAKSPPSGSPWTPLDVAIDHWEDFTRAMAVERRRVALEPSHRDAVGIAYAYFGHHARNGGPRPAETVESIEVPPQEPPAPGDSLTKRKRKSDPNRARTAKRAAKRAAKDVRNWKYDEPDSSVYGIVAGLSLPPATRDKVSDLFEQCVVNGAPLPSEVVKQLERQGKRIVSNAISVWNSLPQKVDAASPLVDGAIGSERAEAR